MILVSQAYTTDSEERNSELARCREMNERSDLFTHVEYLDAHSGRKSFTDLVRHCQEHHRGKWCVISNSDIAFPSSAAMLRLLKKPERLVALTRWETLSGPRFIGFTHQDRFFSGSQDSWAFEAGSIPVPEPDIPLGVIGCDSFIAGWAASHGLEVVNPSLAVRTSHMHTHLPGVSEDGAVIGGFFGYPEITGMSVTGDVLCHDWPNKDGNWEFDWQLLATKK